MLEKSHNSESFHDVLNVTRSIQGHWNVVNVVILFPIILWKLLIASVNKESKHNSSDKLYFFVFNNNNVRPTSCGVKRIIFFTNSKFLLFLVIDNLGLVCTHPWYTVHDVRMGDTLKNLEDVYAKWEKKSQADQGKIKTDGAHGKY